MLFNITIVMPDGSKGTARADYPSSFTAWLTTLQHFPQACRISVINVIRSQS